MLIKHTKNVSRNKCVHPKSPFVFNPPNTTIFDHSTTTPSPASLLQSSEITLFVSIATHRYVNMSRQARLDNRGLIAQGSTKISTNDNTKFTTTEEHVR